MKLPLIQIGNSNHPRKGWEDAFKKMARVGDYRLLDEENKISEFDKNNEWEW